MGPLPRVRQPQTSRSTDVVRSGGLTAVSGTAHLIGITRFEADQEPPCRVHHADSAVAVVVRIAVLGAQPPRRLRNAREGLAAGRRAAARRSDRSARVLQLVGAAGRRTVGGHTRPVRAAADQSQRARDENDDGCGLHGGWTSVCLRDCTWGPMAALAMELAARHRVARGWRGFGDLETGARQTVAREERKRRSLEFAGEVR